MEALDHGGERKQALIKMHPSKTYFDILNPDVEDIRMEDIVHHLSLTNRFGGGTSQPYSVLSHSLLVAHIIARQGGHTNLQRAAFLHDATEAYVQDVNGLLKKTDELAGYRAIEDRLARAIEIRFGLAPNSLNDPAVKAADRLAFDMECSFVRDSMSYVAPDPLNVRHEAYCMFRELWPFGGAW